MVHRRQIPPAADDGQKTLEFPAHGVRPFEHAHLVKPADHQEIRIFPAYGGYVHAGLALQGQDALNAGSAEPRHRPCDVTIRIHEHTGAVFFDLRNQALVIWLDELIEKFFGKHGPVVIAHILGNGHKIRLHITGQRVHLRDLPFQQIFADAGDTAPAGHKKNKGGFQCPAVCAATRKSRPEYTRQGSGPFS